MMRVLTLAAAVFVGPPPVAGQPPEWRAGASLIPALEESIRLLPGAEIGFVRWNTESTRGLGFHAAIYQRLWGGAPGWETITGWRLPLMPRRQLATHMRGWNIVDRRRSRGFETPFTTVRGRMGGMRIRGRGVRCASVVVVFLIAGCAGDAAGQHEEADADLSGAAAGKGWPLARSVGQQVRVQPAGGRAAGPWSVGIRINWNSFRGSLAGIDRRHSLVTQCSVEGACLPVASSGILPARDRGNPGLSAQGILLDVGRVINDNYFGRSATSWSCPGFVDT